MKLVGVMSLIKDQERIKKIFEEHDIQVYSEIDITGHTFSTLREYGWFPSYDVSTDSTFCFAITTEEKAAGILNKITQLQEKDSSEHSIHAFQINVERMI